MADRFIPRWNAAGRKVLFYAREEAGQAGWNDVAPEDFLLSLLREPSHLATRALTALGVDPAGLSQDVLSRIPVGPGRKGGDMKLTPQTKHVIDLCYAEAAGLGNDWIGPEHLLLGLVCGGRGLAGEVLTKRGVTAEASRAQVVTLQQEP